MIPAPLHVVYIYFLAYMDCNYFYHFTFRRPFSNCRQVY